MSAAEDLAQRFHEAYERLAPSFGYATREAPSKPWAEVPEQNRALMIAVCQELADAGQIMPPSITLRDPEVMTWDWKESVNIQALARAIHKVSGHLVHIHEVETNSDQFAIVVAARELTPEQAEAIFWRRWDEEE